MQDIEYQAQNIVNLIGMVFVFLGTWTMFLSTQPQSNALTLKSSAVWVWPTLKNILKVLKGEIKIASESSKIWSPVLLPELFNKAVRWIILGGLLQILAAILPLFSNVCFSAFRMLYYYKFLNN